MMMSDNEDLYRNSETSEPDSNMELDKSSAV